jgi:hypothetical protein
MCDRSGFSAYTVVKINKTDANPNMTFKHLNTIFHHARGKHKQSFTFDTVSTTFIHRKIRYHREKGVEVKVHC